MSFYKKNTKPFYNPRKPYFKNKVWEKPKTKEVYVFKDDNYHDERSGLFNPREHHQSNWHQDYQEYQTPLDSSYYNHNQQNYHNYERSDARFGQGSSQQQFWNKNEQGRYNSNSFKSHQPRTNSWQQPSSNWHQKATSSFAPNNSNQFVSHTDEHQGSRNDWAGQKKPLTTKYYRKLAPFERAKPGQRNFCSYLPKRPAMSAKFNHPPSKLQFVYKIRACLWHRTKMGLHKKKTKLANRQARTREISRSKFLYLRKVHSQYWARRTMKPKVEIKAYNPWSVPTEGRKYLNFVQSYVPSSWQEPKFAYFKHPEYQLYLVVSTGLEYNSLEFHMNSLNFRVMQVVRLQNLILFGSYLSKKQQLVASGTALAEVVRYFCISKDKLKQLCKFGFDNRRLGNSYLCSTARLAHDSRPKSDSGVVMVAARVITIPVKYRRSSNEVYPEYIIQYKDDTHRS